MAIHIFPWQRKKKFFSDKEQEEITAAIRNAEQRTSGEIRLFIESHCPFMDAIDRATEIFAKLKMENTADRNAVLIYIAVKDHQLAIYGDAGIHQRVGDTYWQTELSRMVSDFNRENIAAGLIHCIEDVGEALHTHFPFDRESDKNELPDDIVFGK